MDLRIKEKKLVYDEYQYPVINTTGMTPKEAAEKIIEIVNNAGMFLSENGQGKFSVFSQQQLIGFIETYENTFHKGNCYVKFEFENYNTTLASEIVDLLQERIKRPLQVMLSSEEMEKIFFLEKAGFRCKRKSYELCVTENDLCNAEKKNNPTFVNIQKDPEMYGACARFMYEYYATVHEVVNPLTASYETFLQKLPEKVYFYSSEGEIYHVAFVEENEIAYVGSKEQCDFKLFITGVVKELFKKYEALSFECDDCDMAAMVLKNLFGVEVEESYNTYVREYDM